MKLFFLPIGLFLLASCIKPDACIEVSNDNPKLGEVVTFTDCSAKTDDFIIDFGDGSDKIEKSDKDMTHVFEAPGSFSVTLTAYSKNDKKSDEASVTVSVQEPTLQEIKGTWNLYKEEECNSYMNMIYDTYSFDDDYIFGDNDVVTINSIESTYNLISSTGEITIDGTLYSVVKLIQDQMVLKEELDQYEYNLFYFEKQ